MDDERSGLVTPVMSVENAENVNAISFMIVWEAIAVLRDSYSGCTVAPGDSCGVPSLFAQPSVAWPASFALPHSRVGAAVWLRQLPAAVAERPVEPAVPPAAGAQIAGWRSSLEGRRPSWIACRRIR